MNRRSGSEQSEENEMTVMVVGYPPSFYSQLIPWSVVKMKTGTQLERVFLFNLSSLTTIPGTPFQFAVSGQFFSILTLTKG